MQKRVGICMVGLWLVAASGFGQDFGKLSRAAAAAPSGAPAAEEAAPPPDFMSMGLDELKTQAAAMLQQGDTNAAIGILMICNEKSTRQSADEFNALLNTLLTAGNPMEAERIYQEALAQRNSLDLNYYNCLYQYYVRQGDAQATLGWIAGLQTRPLPPDLRVPAFTWLLEASRAAGPVSRVTDLVPVCITNFDAATARALLADVVGAYDCAADQVSAQKVLDAIELAAPRQAELRLLVTCQRGNLLFSAARWKEAEAYFRKEAKALPDAELAACFRHARACAIRAKQFELLDRLCAWILKEQKEKPGTWQAAAGAWMESAQMRKSAADILARLEALKQMGCPANMLASYYFEYWDVVVKEGKPSDLAALLKFGDQLALVVTDKRDKEIIRACALDGYFLMEDYERALVLLEKPLPDMKGADHANAINKIKAHLALQKGDKKEAIERFRAFMESVKTRSEPQTDLITGLVNTREMCLGLNAKRIGDILSSMNDAQGARAAYQEANDYYAAAQKEAKPDSPESEHIKVRLADLTKLLQK